MHDDVYLYSWMCTEMCSVNHSVPVTNYNAKMATKHKTLMVNIVAVKGIVVYIVIVAMIGIVVTSSPGKITVG